MTRAKLRAFFSRAASGWPKVCGRSLAHSASFGSPLFSMKSAIAWLNSPRQLKRPRMLAPTAAALHLPSHSCNSDCSSGEACVMKSAIFLPFECCSRKLFPFGAFLKLKSQRSDLNRRPAVYETAALPLSYAGASTQGGLYPKAAREGKWFVCGVQDILYSFWAMVIVGISRRR